MLTYVATLAVGVILGIVIAQIVAVKKTVAVATADVQTAVTDIKAAAPTL